MEEILNNITDLENIIQGTDNQELKDKFEILTKNINSHKNNVEEFFKNNVVVYLTDEEKLKYDEIMIYHNENFDPKPQICFYQFMPHEYIELNVLHRRIFKRSLK